MSSPTVGHTRLVEITDKVNEGRARVLAKVEFFNPSGSVKDRTAVAMVESAGMKLCRKMLNFQRNAWLAAAEYAILRSS